MGLTEFLAQHRQRLAEAGARLLLALGDPTDDMLEAAMPDFPDYGHLPEEYRAMLRHVVQENLI